MENIVRQTLLFDFYGELLTEHQQRIFEAVVCNDTGFSEVAAREGISRQGVHDLVRRAGRQLEDYEDKLHLVERFLKIRQELERIRLEAEHGLKDGAQPDLGRIISLADHILEEL